MTAGDQPITPALTPDIRPRRKFGIGRIVLGVVLALLLAILIILLKPPALGDFSAHPDPAASYAETVQRVEAIQAGEDALNPLCATRFMTHGQKAERAIVFIHGYTDCPDQFAQLGEQFYAEGYNVLIAPLPYHGLADRMTTEQGRLTAEAVIEYADDVADIAQGLGDHVTVAGLSLGGVATGWIAQNRADVDLAVLIAPAFGFGAIPAGFSDPLTNVLLLLPDSFSWWNTDTREAMQPVTQYPQTSRHALAQTLRLGYIVRTQAQRSAPAAGSILVITNANDFGVRNEVTAGVVELWQSHGAPVSTFEFDAALGLPHDVIEPSLPTSQVDVVYPVLLEQIAGTD